MKKYDNYKDSGIEWIGDIPEHWDVNRLRNIAKSIKTGSTPPSEEIQYFEPQELNWFAPGDFDNLILDNAKRKISSLAIEENKCKLFPSNSILLIGIGATVGKVGIVSEASTSNQQINAIVLKSEHNPKYYTYFLSTIKDIIVMEASSATLPIFNQTQTKNIGLPVPSIEEQTQIANYLDHKTTQIDTLVDKKEQFISLLQEERTAVINQAVTKGLDPKVQMKDSGIEWLGEIPEQWEIEKLKFKSKIISKGTTPSTVGCEIIDKGEIRYIKSENIVENCLQNNPEFYIDFETNQIIKRSQLEINDVLIVIAGASIGKVAILTEEFYPSNTNQAVSFIRLNNVNSSIFVWYWLQTSFIKERILFDATQSAQPNLSMESIGNFPIPKLSNIEEMEITTFLHKKTGEIDTIIDKTQQEIELLQEYKTALISEVVTGKVDVREKVLD